MADRIAELLRGADAIELVGSRIVVEDGITRVEADAKRPEFYDIVAIYRDSATHASLETITDQEAAHDFARELSAEFGLPIGFAPNWTPRKSLQMRS